jgi:hypothetical protein
MSNNTQMWLNYFERWSNKGTFIKRDMNYVPYKVYLLYKTVPENNMTNEKQIQDADASFTALTSKT